MPILINEMHVEVEPAGVPDTDPGPAPAITAMEVPEQEMASLMAVIEERRERLLVD